MISPPHRSRRFRAKTPAQRVNIAAVALTPLCCFISQHWPSQWLIPIGILTSTDTK